MRVFFVEARQPVTVDCNMPIKKFVVPADSYEDAVKKVREQHPGYLHIYVCEPMYPGDDAQQNYICCRTCPLLDPMRIFHCITSSPGAAEYIMRDGLCPAGRKPIWEPIEREDDDDFHTNEREYDGTWGAWEVTHWMPLPEPPKMKGGE